MYPPPPGWARAPRLIVSHDFDHTTQRVAPADVGGSLYRFGVSIDAPFTAWTCEGTGPESSGALVKIGQSYRIGAYNFTTHTTNGSVVCVGVDPNATTDSNGSMTTPGAIALGPHFYRWDWWAEITSIASVNYLFGLSDTPITGNTNCALLYFDTTATGANWQRLNTAAGVGAFGDTGVAATTGWHKFTGIQAPSSGVMAWHYFIDDVSVGVETANVPVAPMTVVARLRTRTAAAKTMSLDHCEVWTDGAAMVIGGVP